MYCGSAVDFDRRKKQHETMLERNTHFNKWLQDDYNRYGKDSFVFDIVYNCDHLTEPLVKDMEQAYINTGKYKYNRSKFTSKRNAEGRMSNILAKRKRANKYR